jgi:TolB-like protein/DNA-binding winged helix-turn-helix (wHTH) protein
MNRMPGDVPEANSGAFIVGDLHIDVGQQRVTRAGSDIALPNLSLRLLVALVRAAPNVLSNELLMTQVWPGLVVSPETVNKRVNLLREALGDDPREPRYIAGVRSRGYRVIAPVSAAGEAARPLELSAPLASGAAALQAAQIPVTPSRALQPGGPKLWLGRGRWIVLLVLAIGLLGAAAFGIRALVRHPSQVATAVPGANPAAIGASARTVAVLRFDSISADSADAYLAQGLPEMILNRLSRINGLSVIARNSSFSLDTKTIDSREIGRRLNSGYLIDGSVQRRADRLRVAVQLVDTQAGTQVWSAHFDRALGDIFNVEDEIADQVADALSARLGGLEAKPARTERSGNIEAYLAYLRGRTLLGRFNLAESESAVPYLENAIALDPHFAAAYAALYDARMQAADQRREDLNPVRRRYGYLIDRALKLDPKLGAAYFARAMWGEQPHDSSAIAGNPLVIAIERDFRQGAALDPSNGRGLTAYADFLYTLNRVDEGKSVLKRALWVDPMSPSAHFTDATFSLDDGGPKAAEQKTLQVLELDPNFVPALQYYGTYRWLFDGKLAEATQIVEHALALDPENSQLYNDAVSMYLDFGDLAAAREAAAAAPHSERTTALLLMHEGDWRGAGVAAYDEAGWTSDDDYCQNWLASAAIRDYALKTGELGRAIAFIKLKYYFGDTPAAHLDYCNNGAAVDLSQLLAASGEAQQALAVRRAAAAWNDVKQAKYLGGARRLRARILLLDGKIDAALSELAESFLSGEYAFWWYAIENDPLWVPLHSDARFQLIAADVRRYIDAQRRELEVLRRDGLVPRRGVAVSSR